MNIGERIDNRLKAIGISQAELARRVGVRQSTINGLIRGESRGSKHLHVIARILRTSPAYLTGETEDPAPDAPILEPERPVQFVTLQVALPSEEALATMFRAMLRIVPEDATEDERAQILARRLPAALSQLRDLAP
ncbi:helix-turn-helix domain-containing protein [Sphingomonas sp. ABOLD]|uniref:Transcriptional regulator with XRE-family HTH domain n=1 Tax=Sphingomonas trueperi TaxID=53317 RepID=A0A7X5XXQ9_9SPHN|nr:MULTISPECIES: helix-turn-helix domain-containing protein [Sphingomonas]NJB97297.1 transcriptional regulator with XRE-family HTH domain [Sphingomonas trueperi]RSV50598.1 helix-turn-helix domain-containing protein [Sphingomonas sp. ABOLD]